MSPAGARAHAATGREETGASAAGQKGQARASPASPDAVPQASPDAVPQASPDAVPQASASGGGWQVLHAGKFVDGAGVVLERADHEFIARSAGFSDAALRLLARSEPPRMAPMAWQEGFHAALLQTVVKVDGEDHTLRVVDHRAFEGPPERPGRPYRRRTYLLRPCRAWTGQDAALPLEAMRQVPAFATHAIVAPWLPQDETVDLAALAQDLGGLLAGRLHIGEMPSATVARRVSAVLAALPPEVASRITIRIGGEAPIGVLPDTASTAPDAAVGQAWLDVLHHRGAGDRLSQLASAAAMAWPAAPAVDLRRDWEAVRPQLRWAMLVAGWTLRAEKALQAGDAVPACPVDPSPRALAPVLPLLQAADAYDRIGPLGEPAWRAAWNHVHASLDGPWRAVASVLAGAAPDDALLRTLAPLPLDGAAADAAAQAWQHALPTAGTEALAALLNSRAVWAQSVRRGLRDGVVARCIEVLTAEPDPRHPFWRMKEGRALAALLGSAVGGPPATTEPPRAGAAAHEEPDARADGVDPQALALLVGHPVADLVARHGDAAANAAWVQASHRPGDPGARRDAVAACLRLLRAEPIGRGEGFAAAWRRFGLPLPVARALRLGVPYAEVEACLPDVDLEPAQETVARLLACTDLDPAAWTAVAGTRSPWRLLSAGPGHAPDTAEQETLAAVAWPDVPTAATHYAGTLPTHWRHLPAESVLAWLARGGEPARLVRLLDVAPLSVLAAWEAWTRNPQRPPSDGAPMLERHMQALGWRQRRAVQRAARRLEAA